MADDVEVNADEGVIDKSEETEEAEGKKSFFKSKLFMIIAGVIILLLLAGGGYYFFAPSEKLEIESEKSEETGIETDEDNSEPTMAEQMGFGENILEPEGLVDITSGESSPELVEIQQENLQMQQKIKDLEALINQQEMINQDQKSIQDSSVIAPIRSSNSVDYQQDLFDEPSMREPSRTPPPKPNWGKFDRQ